MLVIFFFQFEINSKNTKVKKSWGAGCGEVARIYPNQTMVTAWMGIGIRELKELSRKHFGLFNVV